MREAFESQASGILGWVTPQLKGDAFANVLCEKTWNFLSGEVSGKTEFRDLSYMEETTTRHRDFIFVDEAMDRSVALFLALNKCDVRVLMMGGVASAKTSYLNTFKTLFDKNQDNVTIRIGMTVDTTPMDIEDKIESRMYKKGKTSLGGKGSKKILVIIDDLDMSKFSYFGECSGTLEKLRYLFDRKGFLDFEKFTLKEHHDSSYILAGNPIRLCDSTLHNLCADIELDYDTHFPFPGHLLKHMFKFVLLDLDKFALSRIYLEALNYYCSGIGSCAVLKNSPLQIVETVLGCYYKGLEVFENRNIHVFRRIFGIDSLKRIFGVLLNMRGLDREET
jgi:hypothetical protein